MRYRPIQAALQERVPFTLWGPSRARTVLAAVAASAAALVPVVMVASPAQATSTVLTVGAGTGSEGGNITFAVSYNAPIGNGATYTFTTAATTATAGTDYTVAPRVNGTSATTVTFSGTGSPESATVTVAAAADAVTDTGETFTLTAQNNGTPSDNVTATGTITDVPAFVLTAPTTPVLETATPAVPGVGGAPGTPRAEKTVTVTATLTAPATSPVTIPVSTVAGTAVSTGSSNRDYDALVSSPISISVGDTTGTATVTLFDDTWDETDQQYFDVVASTATAAAPLSAASNKARITIQDDDATPTVSIGTAGQVPEGSALPFPLTLSGRSENAVTADVTTANGVTTDTAYGATAGTDYVALSGQTVSFAPGATSALALVTTSTDNLVEASPESLSATIANPVYATLGTPVTATGGITDANAAPTATLSTTGTGATSGAMSPSWDEGSAGEAAREITVTLNATSTIPVTINYSFSGGTATNGVDYKGSSGTLTIPVGQTVGKIPVTIVGDTAYEPGNETFNVVLATPNGSINSSSVGPQAVTIAEGSDDQQPTYSIGDVSVDEGASGQTLAKVPFTLTAPSSVDTTFTTTLTDIGTTQVGGTNAGGTVGADDWDPPSSLIVTIPAGKTSATLDVPINGDVVYEKAEQIAVAVTSVGGNIDTATVPAGAQHTAKITISPDDAAPKITFNESSGSEGTTLRVIPTAVGLSQYNYEVKFTYAGSGTAPNAATPVDDFDTTAIANQLVPRGTTGALGAPTSVYLLPDTFDEPTESFGVTATEVTATPIGFATSTGVYKINDDPGDLPPTARITDETIGENEQSVDVHVNLTWEGDTTKTTQDITIPYWTVDGSAKANQDYKEVKSTLTIPAGTMSGKINVPIINDKMVENNEDFFVQLGTPGPAGASVARSLGTVVIKSDDDAMAPTLKASASVVAAGHAVTLSGMATPGAKVDLWGTPMGSTSKGTKLATTTAGASGSYSFSRTLSMGYTFEAATGDDYSDDVKVQVQQAPMLMATSSAKGTLSLAVLGNPKGAGQQIVIHRWTGKAWGVAYTGKTGADGYWRMTLKNLKAGTYTYRAFVYGNDKTGVLSNFSATTKTPVK